MSAIRPLTRFRPALRWLLVVAASTAFALTFGLNYAIDNQVVYFLAALRRNDPSVLARDWYATEVTHYHVAITQLVAPLLRWWPSGWAIAVLHVLTIVLGCAAWYLVAERLLRRRWMAVACFLGVLSLSTATKTLSVAVSYVFNEAFQPSTLGSLGFLSAVVAFVHRRWLCSGIALSVSGLFHANFLVLGALSFGASQLLLGGTPRALSKRLALQLGPSLVALAVVVAPMLSTVASEHAAEAQRILFEVRSPHHYTPRAFQRDLAPFLGWTVTGIVATRLLPRSHAHDLLLRWMLSTAGVVWAGTLLTSWEYIPRVAQLFVWRVAPFVDLAGQTLLCAAFARIVWRPRLLLRLSLADWTLLLAGVLALASSHALRGAVQLTVTLSILATVSAVSALAAWFGSSSTNRPRVGAAIRGGYVGAAVATLAFVTGPALATLEQRSSLLRAPPPADAQLIDWVANTTAPDALFLTPPDVQSFRYDARRAIVVDWKATPMLPDEVIEWYERIGAVAGRRNVKSYRDLAGYSQLDTARVRRLDEQYDVDYVLVRARDAHRLRGLHRVFSNAHWVVFEVAGQPR